MKKLTLFAISIVLITFSSCEKEEDNILGCMNSAALNYNALANQDDGSCIIAGCTDATAMNYNSSATINDATCTYYGDVFVGTYDASEECTDDSTFEWEQEITSDNNEITLISAFGWGVDITIPVSSATSFSLNDYEGTIVSQAGSLAVTYSSIEGEISGNQIAVTYIIDTEDENGDIIEFANCTATMTLSDGGGRYSNVSKSL